MSQHAFDDVYRLLDKVPGSYDVRDLTLRYLCALFSELAYYHVPQWEIDGKKRAQLIPCEGYQTLAMGGRATSAAAILQSADMGRYVVVESRGVIAVGTLIRDILFIGFRGTKFLFDWQINVRAKMALVVPHIHYNYLAGRMHAGFTEEALRITIRIHDELRSKNMSDFDHVVLTGHSLGGAVAAISQGFIQSSSTTVCTFGAPRYADISAYLGLRGPIPTQIRRPGDVVPTIPPKLLGYVDHPNEYATNGAPYFDPAAYSSTFGEFVRWGQFILGRAEAHNIERYREEVGAVIKAPGAKLPLISADKLTMVHIGSR